MGCTLSGQCHCGNISVELESTQDIASLVPRECSCSLCQKHRASWISDPKGTLRIKYEKQNLVSSYRFGHRTADFILCAKCGVLMAAHSEIEGSSYAVFNIHSMPEKPLTSPPISTNFDEEDSTTRLARRTKNWTGNVTVTQKE